VLSRRQVLKALGASGTLLFTPLNKVFDVSSADSIAQADTTTTYSGFILLPADAQAPTFIKGPPLGFPKVCGLGDQRATALSSHFNDHGALVQSTNVPLYELTKLPPSASAADGYTIQFDWGGLFCASLDYRAPNPSGKTVSVATLYAQTQFPSPYPFWEETGIQVKRVDFLPVPGIQIATIVGFNFYWISKDVFYQLTLKSNPPLSQATDVASSLVIAH
jgi:hypothetical protein